MEILDIYMRDEIFEYLPNHNKIKIMLYDIRYKHEKIMILGEKHDLDHIIFGLDNPTYKPVYYGEHEIFIGEIFDGDLMPIIISQKNRTEMFIMRISEYVDNYIDNVICKK